MSWKASSVMEERIKFIARATVPEVNFSRLCREFGISRPTGYLWLGRYWEAGSITGVRELSRRPHRSPRRTAAEYEVRVIALRRRYGWGAKKVRELLLREGLDLKVVTINRIFKRNGLVHPDESHRPAVKRFEREQPNELWQMDFKGEFKTGGSICYPLSILDDHSRYAVGLFPLRNKDIEAVEGCLLGAFEQYGVPEAMLMDHGSPWWSTHSEHGLTKLSVGLIKQDIKLYFSGVGHPQTQGKIERFHRTIAQAVRHKGKPQQFWGWYGLFQEFKYEYNHIRPHEAIDMDVPAHRYHPSPRAYKATPKPWEYPKNSTVREVNAAGNINLHGGQFFVSHALAGELVRAQEIEGTAIISFRNMYIREINSKTGISRAIILPMPEN